VKLSSNLVRAIYLLGTLMWSWALSEIAMSILDFRVIQAVIFFIISFSFSCILISIIGVKLGVYEDFVSVDKS